MEDFEKTKNIIIDNLGENTFCELPSYTMSSEDFSWYLQKYPGNFCHLGTVNSKALHSNKYDFDDNLLELKNIFCINWESVQVASLMIPVSC